MDPKNNLRGIDALRMKKQEQSFFQLRSPEDSIRKRPANNVIEFSRCSISHGPHGDYLLTLPLLDKENLKVTPMNHVRETKNDPNNPPPKLVSFKGNFKGKRLALMCEKDINEPGAIAIIIVRDRLVGANTRIGVGDFYSMWLPKVHRLVEVLSDSFIAPDCEDQYRAVEAHLVAKQNQMEMLSPLNFARAAVYMKDLDCSVEMAIEKAHNQEDFLVRQQADCRRMGREIMGGAKTVQSKLEPEKQESLKVIGILTKPRRS